MKLTMRRIGTYLPFLFALSGIPTYATQCENLTALTIPSITVTAAVAVPAGLFSPGVRAVEEALRRVLSRRFAVSPPSPNPYRDSHRNMAAGEQRLEQAAGPGPELAKSLPEVALGFGVRSEPRGCGTLQQRNRPKTEVTPEVTL